MADPSSPRVALQQAEPQPTEALLVAEVRAFGLSAMRRHEIAEFRRRPAPIRAGGKAIPSNLLKASDEQTVVAVAAILAAGAKFDPDRFEEWGVVAAPRFVGRGHLAMALDRFAAEGVWGVSPNIIPHNALHCPAGTLSIALGLHGPNLGVGGGTDSVIQGVLTALSWLEEGRVPGVWLVITGHTPEFIPGLGDIPPTDSECQALALAIMPDRSEGARGVTLRLIRGDAEPSEAPLNLVATAARLEPGRPVKRPVEGLSIYRPHLKFRPADRHDAWTIATDSTSGLRVELAVDLASGTQEDDR